MPVTGDYQQILLFVPVVHEPVAVIDAAAVSFSVSQRLWLPNARHEAVPLDVLYEGVDAREDSFVCALPFYVLFPRLICKTKAIHCRIFFPTPDRKSVV
jgi:hypothetical protein